MRKWLDVIHQRLVFAADRSPVLTVLMLFAAGIIFWGGFNTTMELTNTETFCISCHEMRDNVYPEYKTSVHYMNTTGVRASCPDCHVPKQWVHMFVRKIKATNELYHHLAGSIGTQEKFREKRLHLARIVWDTMRRTDSRECQNCHDMSHMALEKQSRKAMIFHEYAQANSKTCIDCHKGIAHRLPQAYVDRAFEDMLDTMHIAFENRKDQCYVCHEGMAHSDWD